ncbi:MAG: cotH 3, partial [Verrucomicrobiales bacterium]|nr:cotH 3 [Verrucomicrobiales bacterium]
IPGLRIDLTRDGIASLNRSPRIYVKATVREGGKWYTNVAVHLKGSFGSFRGLNDTPALTVNFDHFAAGQTFHGLKKIHLNNSIQDHSYLSEKICRELFEAAGVPVPRAGNARVNLNGRDLGMYVLVEGINKQFLKRYFKDAKGNVYDAHQGKDVTDNLPVNSGENPDDKTRLRALANAARVGNLDARLTSLEKTLDLDRFLSFMALEMILCDWDGYTLNQNNYRIFHDRDSDRMVFIPQGLDQMLGESKKSLFPTSRSLVARAVLEIPEGRRRYRERLMQLSTNVFKPELIIDRVHEVAERIEAVMEQTDPQAAAAHKQRAASFCRKVQQRSNYLRSQLFPETPMQFATLGTGSLTNWESRRDLGEADLNEEQDPEGHKLLHIATKAGCTASWRTTRMLDSGKYEFQARIKTAGVVLNPSDPRAGAGLRVSRHREGQKNAGDKSWTPVKFDFEVHEPSDIELVCELRANQGDVWFDVSSLNLKRK